MICPEEVLEHAVTFYRADRLAEAQELCQAVLQAEPAHAEANFLAGLVSLRQGLAERALPNLQSAWEVAPSEGRYWLALTECLLALGRFDDESELIKQAVRRGMDSPEARQLQLVAKRGRDKAEPPPSVKEAVLASFRAQRAVELEALARTALAQYPGWVLGWSALGAALSMMGRDAEAPMRRAMQLAPQSAEVHNNLGVHLRERGRIQEGLEYFRKAIRLRPKYAEAHFNLGAALCELGQYREAKDCFDRAIAIRPNYFDAMVELSIALIGLGREHEAQDVLRRVLKLNPDNPKAFTNLLFATLHRSDLDASQIFAEHKRFGEQFDQDGAGAVFGNARDANRDLRIGIVSGDLRHHAVASFLEPVLAQLACSKRLFLCVYYNYSVVDDVTNRLQKYVASWEMVAGMGDDELVQKIRSDGIDILIDLSGHTAHNRLLTFARRAAPVQASWIGYPGTTGLKSMDYYLGDRYFLPPGMFDEYFTEKIVRLPANAPFLPVEGAPDVNGLPALQNGYMTFGSFNRISKISRMVVALWSRLLRALPESRLVLGGMPTDREPAELLGWFAEEDIARERLTFYGRTTVPVYLGQHEKVDICLDTFPYNGGTTTCHAAWMGVPTLSLVGETVVGRVGATILGHLGLDEFVAHDADEFVRKGVEWAGRLDELAQLRQGMRERFAGSALSRPELIATGLEQALRIMWRRWCEGLPPESFEVDGAASSVQAVASEEESLLREAAEHYAAGRAEEAEWLCKRVLELQAGHADANYNLGMMALERGSPEESLPYLLAAWEVSPQVEQYWLMLGKCLLEMCKFEEAIALADEAIGRGLDTPAIRQAHLLAKRGRGHVEPVGDASGEMVRLFAAGQYEEVERRAERMLEEYPGWIFGWKALGASRGAQGRSALRALRNASLLAPLDADACSNLGLALLEEGFMDEALQSYRHALDIAPDDPAIYSSWLYARVLAGEGPAKNLFAEHLRFAERFEAPLEAGWGELTNKKDPERSLKLGFVSGDLLVHAVANFIEPVLGQLVRMPTIELTAYYNHVREDVATMRLQGYFAHWNRVGGMSDEDLAQKIRADGIDILIDLSGHTGRNRLLTFARRAAPVQASWIGYPGTTGLKSMDYYLGDRYFLPPGMFDEYFTEKIVRLPANAPFLPVEGAPDVNGLPALQNGYVTFGSFNRISKVGRPVVALWSSLLRALPDSRMIIGGMPEDGGRGDVGRWFGEEGIELARVDFLPRSTMRDYLGFLLRVDICLDTFPHNGGTTTCHAAWMGVLTLSLVGETVVGRVGATILGHLGLDEFAAHDADEFVRKGVAWSGRLDELARLRLEMRERFTNSALGRPEVIAFALEQALRTMWRRWCAGLPAESFGVDGADIMDVVNNVDAQEAMLRDAVEHYQAGRLDEAEQVCRSILQRYPSHADAHYNLGLIALERGRFEDAGALAEVAIGGGLDTPEIRQLQLLADRGRNRTEPPAELAIKVVNLLNAGHYAELEGHAEAALKEYPGWVLGWNALGVAKGAVGKDAESAVRRAVELGPEDAEAHNNLGFFLRERGRKEEALASFQRALQLKPEFVEANFNLGATLQDLGRNDEAIACFRKVIAIKPDYIGAWASLGSVLKEQGKIPEALEVLRRLLAENPDHTDAWNYLLFGLIHSDDYDADTAFAEHCRFGERFEGALRSTWPEFGNSRDPERILQVGFVSGDFFLHTVANFIEPVLMHLSGSGQLSLHAYYNHMLEDDVTQRLKGYFAHWDVVAGMTDDELAQKIRADDIDILIDLSGHTGRNRLLTFARKAAPIQASWIGYPGTTGLQAMDYYLGDRHYLPPGQFDRHFTEKIVRLPANAPFLPVQGAPAVNELPALSNGYVTFGSFNRMSKISRPVVALWARLLCALPESRMLLGGLPTAGGCSELLGWFEQEGIARERLTLHERTDIIVYLAQHQQVDICLDTFPYNGGTTTCHAAWMGVPTLTLAGDTVTGRVGATILGHLGLEEFVAYDADEFVRKGVEWAGRLDELAGLRLEMRERFVHSAMGLPEVIAAGLEKALRIMWRRWCAGLPAESFEVDISDNPVEMLRHAAEHYQAGRLDEAEQACRSILQTHPGHADAHYNLGMMALERGQTEDALPHLQAAWEGVPTEGQYWLTLGECLLALGRFTDAQALAEEAIRRGLDTPQTRHMRLRAIGGLAMNEAIQERSDG